MDEPVTFAMFAAQMRLGSDTSEQALIEGYIIAAREWMEDHTGHILVQREIIEQFGAFDRRLKLTKRPAVEISSVDFIDEAGESGSYIDATLWLEGRYAYAQPALDGWPRQYRRGSIAVTYVAGYEPLEVPQRFIQAILLMAAEFYRNRSAASLSGDVERAVANLLRSFRNRTL